MLLSIALLTGSALTLVACETFPPKLTPVELAEQHIKKNIEIHSNTIAAFAVRDLPVAKDVLGEYVERQVHELVKWQYAETDYLGDDLYMVKASASVSIPVDVQAEQLGTRITGQIDVMLPLDVTVDHAAQRVLSGGPKYDEGTVNVNLTGLEEVLKQKARGLTESAAEDAKGKLKDLLKRGE